MTLLLDSQYKLNKEVEIFNQISSGITSIGEAIKARGQKVIDDNPNPVKDYVIKLAKERGNTVTREQISDVKFEHMNGEEKDWGLDFLGFEVLEDKTEEKILLVYSETVINDKETEDKTQFEYGTDITDSTSWTIQAGCTIKGGVEIFKGWELRLDVTYQNIHEETKHWLWKKEIVLPPHSKTEIDACLKQHFEDIYVKAAWKVTKGTACCSCNINKCGKRHRTANIPITDILVNQGLQTLDAYGVVNDLVSLRGFTDAQSEPYP